MSRADYDWNEFGHPRVAMLNRILCWVSAIVGSIGAPLAAWYAATSDWTLVFPALLMAVAIPLPWMATRKVYRAAPLRPDYAAIARWEKAEYGEIRSTRADGSPIADPDAAAARRDWPLNLPPRRGDTAATFTEGAFGRFGVILPAPAGACPQGHGCASYWTEQRGPVCPSCEDERHQEWRLRSGMTTINEERERLAHAIPAHGSPAAACRHSLTETRIPDGRRACLDCGEVLDRGIPLHKRR